MTTIAEPPGQHPLAKYIRPGARVTTFCPGCGDGTIAHAVLRAIDELGAPLDDYVFVCGIGCAGWIASPYFNADTLHTTHGRSLAFATGVKLARPDRRVVVISGDGDLTAIGGNHLIHAARRDLDLTVVCVNNRIYGMTGGQVAPTTPTGISTATTPYGSQERPFDLCRLVAAAGASYVARWTAAQPRFVTRAVRRGLEHRGFAFVEVVTQCPVQYGKVSGEGSAQQMHQTMEANTVTLRQAAGLEPAALAGKWVVGEFVGGRETARVVGGVADGAGDVAGAAGSVASAAGDVAGAADGVPGGAGDVSGAASGVAGAAGDVPGGPA